MASKVSSKRILVFKSIGNGKPYIIINGINLNLIRFIDYHFLDNQHYLLLLTYRCKLSRIPVSRPINGQDACSPDKPANLTLEKLKLHYVVHYMLRGTWSDIVPEEVDEGRVEAYKCNICQKKFKNNYEKKEFPARGSVICHIATDHGRLIEAMKKDSEIDMQSVRGLSFYLAYFIRHE